jgi:NAD(P)-dependent dehydrogenase (short-subunit alcohol dehydrogenase family)
VVVNNRQRDGQPDSAGAVADAIRAGGGRALADRHDVTVAGAAEAMVAAAVRGFGGLDVLVINAGITGPVAKVGALDEAILRQVMETNFFSAAALVTAALPHLRARGRGSRIVFVSSTAGLHGLKGRPAYAASKGAMNGYALSLADELRRDGIGVNVLMPYAATDMTAGTADGQAARLAPALCAPLCVRLASADWDGTGAIWVTGGGRVRRAAAVEGPSAGLADWEALELPAPGSFSGAEAAFASLSAEVREP